MIDTHAHLSTRFSNNAKIEGVKVILAASNLEDSKENIELARVNKNQLWASVGIHPQKTDTDNKAGVEEQIRLLDQLVANNRELVVAIGECGLDFSPAPPEEEDRTKEEQERLFRGQIEIAQKYNLPLIIHARKAVDEVIEILGEYKNLSGVFHCWAGGKKRVEKVLELGKNWYFGIDGNITYEVGLNEVVAKIRNDRLVLETDSPFLTPIPHRGEINRPEYIKFVYEKVSEIWQLSFEETEKIVDKNAKDLFKIIL